MYRFDLLMSSTCLSFALHKFHHPFALVIHPASGERTLSSFTSNTILDSKLLLLPLTAAAELSCCLPFRKSKNKLMLERNYFKMFSRRGSRCTDHMCSPRTTFRHMPAGTLETTVTTPNKFLLCAPFHVSSSMRLMAIGYLESY